MKLNQYLPIWYKASDELNLSLLAPYFPISPTTVVFLGRLDIPFAPCVISSADNDYVTWLWKFMLASPNVVCLMLCCLLHNVVYSVKWFCSWEKIALGRSNFRYFHQTSTIAFTVLSTVKTSIWYSWYRSVYWWDVKLYSDISLAPLLAECLVIS